MSTFKEEILTKLQASIEAKAQEIQRLEGEIAGLRWAFTIVRQQQEK